MDKMNNPNISAPTKFDKTEWRKNFVLGILRAASMVGLILIIFTYQTITPGGRYLMLALYAGILAITFLPIPHDVRSYGLILITLLIGFNAIFNQGPRTDGTLFILTGIVLAALLVDQRVDIVLLAISTFGLVIIALLEQSNLYNLIAANTLPITSTNWIIYIVGFFVTGVVLITAIDQFKDMFAKINNSLNLTVDQLEKKNLILESQIAERTEESDSRINQLRATSNIAKTVTEIQDVQNLLQSVVDSITTDLKHYHAGIYILDDKKKSAFLQSASSDTGKQLVGNLFQIEPANRSLFNTVIEKNKPVIYSDTEHASYLKDENFPITRSRLVLPLLVHENLFGMLDIHSDQPLTFTSNDAEFLQPLADLVSVTFDNIRLLNETRALTAELERYTSTQTSQVWDKLTSRHKPAYQYTPVGVRPVFSRSNNNDEENKLNIPLMLQGKKIGSIKLQRKGAVETWSQKEKELLLKIADQVALAIENSRLVDDAQKGAQRDKMLATISQRIRETLDIEAVASTAATELRRIFDLKEAEISIGLPQSSTPPPKTTGTLRLKR